MQSINHTAYIIYICVNISECLSNFMHFEILLKFYNNKLTVMMVIVISIQTNKLKKCGRLGK